MEYNLPEEMNSKQSKDDQPTLPTIIPSWVTSGVEVISTAFTMYFTAVTNDFGYVGIQDVNATHGAILFSIWDNKLNGCKSNSVESRKDCNPKDLAICKLAGMDAKCMIFEGEDGGVKVIVYRENFPVKDKKYYIAWESFVDPSKKERVHHRTYFRDSKNNEWELIGHHTTSLFVEKGLENTNAYYKRWWHHNPKSFLENWSINQYEMERSAYFGPTFLYTLQKPKTSKTLTDIFFEGKTKFELTSGIFVHNKEKKENHLHVNGEIVKKYNGFKNENENVAKLAIGGTIKQNTALNECTGFGCRRVLEEGSGDQIGYGSGGSSGNESEDIFDPILELEKIMLCLSKAGTRLRSEDSLAAQMEARKEIERCLDKNFGDICLKKSKANKKCKTDKVGKKVKAGKRSKK